MTADAFRHEGHAGMAASARWCSKSMQAAVCTGCVPATKAPTSVQEAITSVSTCWSCICNASAAAVRQACPVTQASIAALYVCAFAAWAAWAWACAAERSKSCSSPRAVCHLAHFEHELMTALYTTMSHMSPCDFWTPELGSREEHKYSNVTSTHADRQTDRQTERQTDTRACALTLHLTKNMMSPGLESSISSWGVGVAPVLCTHCNPSLCAQFKQHTSR